MRTVNSVEIDDFTLAYIECALWTETDNATPGGGNPLDSNYTEDDIDPDTLRKMVDDCRQFRDYVLPGPGKCTVEKLLAKIPDHKRRRNGQWSADELDGHDFWLTRNGHGAGFWDRGYGKVGDILTDAAHSFGTYDLYVGDNGIIYGS